MRPGGRLILHTSPNTTFERVVYPNYSRRINQAALAVSKLLRINDGLFNDTMLPTSREFPHDTFERTMHINEQSLDGLRAEVERHGFRVTIGILGAAGEGRLLLVAPAESRTQGARLRALPAAAELLSAPQSLLL